MQWPRNTEPHNLPPSSYHVLIPNIPYPISAEEIVLIHFTPEVHVRANKHVYTCYYAYVLRVPSCIVDSLGFQFEWVSWEWGITFGGDGK